MPPNVDYSELKKVIDALRDEVAAVKEKQIEIHRLLEKLTAIDTENKYRDEKIRELDDRMTDLEQYSRINDVIVSGLRIRPRSFARAVATNNGSRTEPEEEDVASAEQQVVAFLQAKDIHLDCSHIEACHPLSMRKRKTERTNDNRDQRPDTPRVILRFTNRKHNIALLKEWKKLKGTDVYMNEHLVKRNANIAKEARDLRKNKKIQQTWTRNCKVFIKLNGDTPEEAKVMVIRSIEELGKY